jgi:magnesium-transporting ATPase (P-type)
VIIDAIKESREIFQRMNSYAIYRIAETLRVPLFMTLSIVVFNVFPVTAIMIVMLALFNDGAILSIAYDNAPSTTLRGASTSTEPVSSKSFSTSRGRSNAGVFSSASTTPRRTGNSATRISRSANSGTNTPKPIRSA